MNILDWLVLLLIIYITLNGVYRGFIHSALSLAAFFFSWLCAVFFTPIMARSLLNNRSIYTFIYNFTEGSERIVSFEDTKLLISDLSDNQLNTLIKESNLPVPFNTLIKENIHQKAFESFDYHTLGDYYDIAISNIFINILSFVIIFFIATFVFAFIINSLNYTLKFPVLRKYDTILGVFLSFIRGCFFTYSIFMLVPLALILIPVTQVYDILYNSLFASVFYSTNFMFNFIKGVI